MVLTDRVVLITGCSSGIGDALCREFHQRGDRVVATARRIESLESLQSEGILTERLDVNNSDDIDRVVETILKREGKIDILINNAGFGLMKPAIELSNSDLLSQFQTNAIAPLALARKVFPSMRDRGSGIIVNTGSISGIIPTPFAGAYCASKAALHALSDAMRMELSPFGIQVITVQPGAIQSQFGENAAAKVSGSLQSNSAYQSIQDRILQRATVSQINATPTDRFAKQLVDRLVKSNPPAVIRLGKQSFFLPLLKLFLPLPTLDRLLKQKFGLSSMRDRSSS